MRLALRVLATSLLAITLGIGLAGVALPAQAQGDATENATENADGKLLSADRERFEKRVVARVNRARARRGLARIRRVDRCVDGMSERWAARIRRTGALVHRDQRITLARCRLAWSGETLVRGSGLTPASAVRAWLLSPAHRAVLLKRRARWAGIGIRVDGDGRVIGVLNVGDPT